MTGLVKQSTAINTINLLAHYSFDLGGYTAIELVEHWSSQYPAAWLQAAVVEALYQGRYKAVSVDQILTFWHRRGEPRYHFSHEFERIICSKLPKSLTGKTDALIGEWSELDATLPAPDAEPNPRVPAADQVSGMAATATDAIPVMAASTPFMESDSGWEDSTLLPHAHHLDEPLIHTFKPTDFSKLNTLVPQGNWSRDEAVRQPIHQFIPAIEASNFYIKLKAVSQSDEAWQPSFEPLILTAGDQASV
jgi:hypothetical protein